MAADILAGDISARTFHSGEFSDTRIFSAQELFGMGMFLALWMFRHGDVTVLEHFRPRIFWHTNYIALQDAKMYIYQNVHGPKYPYAKIFQCQNILMPKCSSAITSMVPKCPCAEKVPMIKCPCHNISCQSIFMPKCPSHNIHVPKSQWCRNVLVPKSPHDEMSVPKYLLPKCQASK